MKPNYVAKKSAWGVVNFWVMLLCIVLGAGLIVAPMLIWPTEDSMFKTIGLLAGAAILAVFFIVTIIRIIIIKHDKVEFYDDKVVQKWGVFSRNEKQSVFIGIRQVEVKQSLWGRITKMGNVQVDVVGHWDIDLDKIKYPKRLRSYLSYNMEQEAGEVTHIISG